MNFCKKVSKGVNKPITKFIKYIEYGIASSGSCLISNISRSLNVPFTIYCINNI